jgi:hypothetical protein
MRKLGNLWNLQKDIVCHMVCLRELDNKQTWTPSDRSAVTTMLRNLQDYTAKITEHYQRDRHLQV